MWQTTKRSKQSRRPPAKERRRERGDNSVGSLGSNGAPAGSVEHSISRNEPYYSDNEGERVSYCVDHKLHLYKIQQNPHMSIDVQDRDDSLPNSMKAASLKETNQIIDFITSTTTTNETAASTTVDINPTVTSEVVDPIHTDGDGIQTDDATKKSGDNDVAKDEADEEQSGDRGEGVREGAIGGKGEDDHSEISKHSSEEVSENDEDDDDQDRRDDGNKNEEGKERGSTTQPGQTNREKDDKGQLDQKQPSEKKKISKSKKDKIRDKRKQREKERERTRQEEANARRTMMRQGAAAKSKAGKQKLFYSSDDGSNVRSDPAHHIHPNPFEARYQSDETDEDYGVVPPSYSNYGASSSSSTRVGPRPISEQAYNIGANIVESSYYSITSCFGGLATALCGRNSIHIPLASYPSYEALPSKTDRP